MSYCYILFSQRVDKFYVGISTVSIQSRLEKHNNSGYGNHFTSQTDDWEVFLAINCECNSQALNIERHIKRMKSRTYIENLKKYPEIIAKLKSKYSCN